MSSTKKKSTKHISSSEEDIPVKSKVVKMKTRKSSSSSPVKIKKKVTSSKTKTKEAEKVKEEKEVVAYKLKLSRTQKSDYVALDSIKAGPFKNYLTNLLNKDKYTTINLLVPDSFLQKSKYMSGLKSYIDAATKEDRNWQHYGDTDFYRMAVVAYTYRDVSPLLNVYKKIRKLINDKLISDRFYWIYLAKDEELFYPTLEIEMFRRRTVSTLKLINLKDYPFHFEEHDKKNILSLDGKIESEVVSPQVRVFPANQNFLPQYIKSMEEGKWSEILANVRLGEASMSFYHGELPQLCHSITKIGGILAGGFVNSMVNPTFFLQEIYTERINYGELVERGKEITFTNTEADSYIFQEGKTLPTERSRFGGKQPLSIIPGFQECVRVFYARQDRVPGISDFLEEQLELDRIRYADYDLEAELKRLNKHILVKDGKIYQLIYYFSPDIDVFVTGDDYLAKTNRILDILVNKIKLSNNRIYYGEHATTFDFGHYFPKIQLIKRAYPNVEEIMAGFDIDPSRVAMLWQNGQQVIVAPQSYINAVNYGINLIVPCRQSETFNSRLAKYYNKGYEPFLPAKLTKVIVEKKFSTHTYGELIAYKNKSHTWVRRGDDYEKLRVNDLTVRFLPPSEGDDSLKDRRSDIIKGKLEPNKEDLLYLVGLFSEELTKLENTYRAGQVNYFMSLLRALVKYITSLFWRVDEPGSQLTASFNPTHKDYLAGNGEKGGSSSDFEKTLAKEEKSIAEKEKADLNILLGVHLHKPLNIITASYHQSYLKEIYINVLKLRRAFMIGNGSPYFGDELLNEFNGGSIVEMEKVTLSDEEGSEEVTSDKEGGKMDDSSSEESSSAKGLMGSYKSTKNNKRDESSEEKPITKTIVNKRQFPISKRTGESSEEERLPKRESGRKGYKHSGKNKGTEKDYYSSEEERISRRKTKSPVPKALAGSSGKKRTPRKLSMPKRLEEYSSEEERLSRSKGKSPIPKGSIESSEEEKEKVNSSLEKEKFFFRQVGVKDESYQVILKEALETWDAAGTQPYKALQEDGYYAFFMSILKEQSLILDAPLYRGTMRHSKLKVGDTFNYDYPSSWSTSENKATPFGTPGDPGSILLSFTSVGPVRGINNPFNSNEEDEVILYPMKLKINKITKKGGKATFHVVGISYIEKGISE